MRYLLCLQLRLITLYLLQIAIDDFKIIWVGLILIKQGKNSSTQETDKIPQGSFISFLLSMYPGKVTSTYQHFKYQLPGEEGQKMHSETPASIYLKPATITLIQFCAASKKHTRGRKYSINYTQTLEYFQSKQRLSKTTLVPYHTREQ